MKSEVTADFNGMFKLLPERIKRNARRKYNLWKVNPSHPGLAFKRLKTESKIYSIRNSLGYRALGVQKDNDTIIWFWVGSHSDYDNFVNDL